MRSGKRFCFMKTLEKYPLNFKKKIDMKKFRITIWLLLLLFLKTQFLFAQELGKEEKAKLLEKIKLELINSYIIESTAIEMAAYLDEKIKSGQYEGINNGEEFAIVVTSDLRKVSKDLHLGLMYSEKPIQSGSEKDSEDKWVMNFLQSNGYGIKQKEILEGNIGYFQIPFFGPIAQCADSLFDAMVFVAETDALIIDLRECQGSLDPDMIPLLCGYFFEKPVHLFNFENREKNTIRQMWSAAYVPGKRYHDKPVYILTSGRTFSGGEELAYDLKHLDKAIIVGQATKGGAQPTYPVYLNEHFVISIPKERSVNAVTKTNWEQVGVKPTIETDANRALTKAHQLAVQSIISKTIDPTQKQYLSTVLQNIEKNQPVFKKVQFNLNGYLDAKEVFIAGSFNFWAPKNNPLIKQKDGWTVELEMSAGSHGYKFVVDDQWILDPANQKTIEEGGIINSVLVVEQ